jgi:hypothetical protein
MQSRALLPWDPEKVQTQMRSQRVVVLRVVVARVAWPMVRRKHRWGEPVAMGAEWGVESSGEPFGGRRPDRPKRTI